MGGSSNNDNSFIPKRGTNNRARRTGSQQVYLFTLVTYVLFFATLVATAGIFLYNRYIDQQLTNQVSALDVELNRFHQSDMDKVRTFDGRLENSKERIAVATSLSVFFTALENATAKTAKLSDLSVDRQADSGYLVLASVETNTFDSSIFQREFYEQDSVIGDVSVKDLQISDGTEEGKRGVKTISFVAELNVPLSAVTFQSDSEALVNSAALEDVEVNATNSPATIEQGNSLLENSEIGL